MSDRFGERLPELALVEVVVRGASGQRLVVRPPEY